MSTGYKYSAAFARPAFVDQYGNGETGDPGITSLEYFAAKAMQGLAANPGCMNMSNEEIATTAVDMASELSKALEKYYRTP